MNAPTSTETSDLPRVRLLRGNPTPHELAALVAVLHTLANRTGLRPPQNPRRRDAPWRLGGAPASVSWRAEPLTPATVRRATAFDFDAP